MRTNVKLALAAVLGMALGAACMDGLHAQQQGGIKRTLLQQVDLHAAPGQQVILGVAEIAPGVMAGHHYHHGEELGYVLDGTLELLVDGQPPQTFKPGQSYHIDFEKPHDARAVGGGPVKVLGVYVVEKGKPLAEPVP